MAENRVAREVENREFAERPKQWMPPELLPEPDKQAGFEYKWIRVSMLNEQDPRNISSKMREGWEPVPVSEQPKLKMIASREGRFAGEIEIGGLLLCKRPEEFGVQQAEYYANITKQQAEAVDNNLMRQNDPRMPLFNERRTSVSFGGRK